MTVPAKLAALCLCGIMAAAAESVHAVEALAADALIFHATIVPSRDGAPDAVAFQGSRIVAMGKSDDLLAACPPSCVKVDAEGKFLLPGFHDSHVHLESGGKAFFEVKLDRQDIPSIQSALRDYAKANPTKEWIMGGTWWAGAFDAAHPPHRRDLDAVESQRPIALRDTSGHELWVNTAALKLAGITRDTPDPQGGRIVRDADGEPTGVLLEAGTYQIYAHLPVPTIEEVRTWILKGQEIALACGVTSAQGNAVPFTIREANVYADLEREGLLIQRSFLWGNLAASPVEFEATVKFAHALRPDGRVQVVAFKGFVDGVLSSQTAAMFEPYANKPGERGLPKMGQQRLNELVLRANRAGFPVALHAIGDRAVRMALDAFENSQTVLGTVPRNRVEHASVIAPDDVPRFGKLGVVASTQPAFMFFPSRKELAAAENSLGAERMKNLFLWKSLQDSGATLIYSSDFPSSGRIGPDPIAGLHCLVHRTLGDGTPFTPEQRLDAGSALAGYTAQPADVIGRGKSLGRIEVGYEADLILLDQDPRLALATSAVRNPPRKIWIAGKRVK
ncbi:MAG: amidohydrolase [Chthoniobacter sp.]|uniref:amidohydrolase n=1 Tax=Chthoniobacter sp. TaxID=2510640 RepID=UPI0032A963F2